MSLNDRRLRLILILVAVLLTALLVGAWVWPELEVDELRPAPEAEVVLDAQAGVPFQVLIPAYLPAGFRRKDVRIQTDLTGPQGEAMARLVYSHPRGVDLTLEEWAPAGGTASMSGQGSGISMCTCMCRQEGQCNPTRLMVELGRLRITAESSDPALLSGEHVRLILTTLAPAGGLLTYSSIQDLPLLPGLPPAEEVPLNAAGVQELVLVISPDGYSPVHFSVQKGIPVRLTFRQLGEVGCGNELLVQWGVGQQAQLVLESPSDTQVLEFTPQESGDFLYYCPHYIYQGVMTVVE